MKKYKTHIGFNGNSLISVSFPPTFRRVGEFNSFLWYSMKEGNVSLVINRKKSPAYLQSLIKGGLGTSEFYDEGIIESKVPSSSII